MKKLFAITMAAVVAASLLAGCSKDTAVTETKEAESQTVAGADAEAAAETAAETEAQAASDGQESILSKDENGNYIKPDNYGTVNKLGQYKGLTAVMESAEVTDEEVEEEIKSLLKSNAEQISVDRPAELGDVCSIDYVGKMDGVAFDGGTGSADLELGSHTFIEGFEEGLVGVKKGDKITLNVTFPEEYHSADLAGKPATFDVTVNDVKENRLPEITDEWVREYTDGEETSAEEFRKGIRQDLEEYRRLDVESTVKNRLVSDVLAASDIVASQEAIEYEYQTMMKTYKDYAAQMGMEVDDYLNAYGIDPEAMKIQLSFYAEESAKQKLMEDEIFKKEGLELTDKDRQAIADLYGYDIATMQSIYGEDNFDAYARSYKIVQFIFDNAVIQKAE